MSLVAGQTIGRYRIISEIGAGGMGVVYRAVDEKLERELAIKILSPGVLVDESARRRFRHEAKILSRLNHSSIQTIHDFDTIEGHDLLVSELVPGVSLDKRVLDGPIPEKELVSLGVQLAQGLTAAHAEGILHRDLKPANLRVTPDGRLKILDFGLATISRAALLKLTTTMTLTEEAIGVAGTLPYMSPEQLIGEKVDERSDIYSTGATLFELATRRLPFESESMLKLVDEIMREQPPRPSALNPKISQELERIILRCIEKDPDLRYQSAKDLAADLKRIEVAGTRPPSSRQFPIERQRNWLPWRIVTGLLAILLAGALAYKFRTVISSSPDRPVSLRWEQITNVTDSAQVPTVSPDGKMVVFIRGSNDFGLSLNTGQLWLKVLGEDKVTQLTDTPQRKQTPEFSLDSNRIYFTQGENRFTWNTYEVSVLRNEAPKLFLPNATGLSWTAPDRLLYSTIKSGVHMALVASNRARSDERDLYVPADHTYGMVHRSAMSPDKKWILAVEMDGVGWLPCRLLPADASNTGRSVGPPGRCTWARWSIDGKWMFFSADSSGGGFHIWRQKFPDGKPEQLTPSSASEEEGLAIMPDGKSLITSVGTQQSVIWIHDGQGDRPLTNEGYSFFPSLAPDGKTVYYLQKGGSSRSFTSGELWKVDVATGRQEPVLPGLTLAHFSLSPDGQKVAFAVAGEDKNAGIWIAYLDRTQPPRQLTSSGESRAFFGPGGDILYQSTTNPPQLMRMQQDGSNVKRVTEEETLHLISVSPDGKWVVAGIGAEGGHGDRNTVVKAFPVDGGSPVVLCDTCLVGFGPSSRSYAAPVSWSPDGKWMYYSLRHFFQGSKQTLALPVTPGAAPLPMLRGVATQAEALRLRGARLLSEESVTPSESPNAYVFTRKTATTNLFRLYFEP